MAVFLSKYYLVAEWLLIRPAFLCFSTFLTFFFCFSWRPLCYISLLYCTSVLVLYYEALTAVIKKTKTGALRWKYQQQLGQERCSTDIIRKENFLGHTSTFYTLRRSELFRKFAVGWSSREMIATTASGSPRAILEQASIIREDFRESQKW